MSNETKRLNVGAIAARARRVYPKGAWDGDEAERARVVVVEDVSALVAEVRRLREIIEGRVLPPTDEEIHAHRQVGAGWMVSTPRERGPASPQFVDHSEARDGGAPHGSLWWPLDADGKPCAWPVAP